jgi:beta-mannosidase
MPAGSGVSTPAGRHVLSEGWECCATPAGRHTDPSQLPLDLAWIPATVPGTAAGAMRQAGLWSIDGPERRFDADDWWFRAGFEVPDDTDPANVALGFDGLATLCDVWLNGAPLLRSENMFIAHRIDRPPVCPGHNELLLRFRSLDVALKARRPRPRWRAPMIENQQLRWFRTTLLGRTPGWSPPAAAVGPWRPAWIDFATRSRAEVQRLDTRLNDGTGFVRLALRPPAAIGASGTWTLRLLDREAIVAEERLTQGHDGMLHADLSLREPRRWWPHTHGDAALYDAVLCHEASSGEISTQALGKVGFRDIKASATLEAGFKVRVNGVDVFCRGACWTPLDVVTLGTTQEACREAIRQVVDAGFNMLRVSGATVYEHPGFFDLCDEYGVLVWQDFMFANMDFPADDAAFAASIEAEAMQQLRLWSRHSCVAVLCGNSEVSQQAAMWGAPRDLWSPALFDRTLAELASVHCASAAYWPSSAFGGAIPHAPDAGTASYYGVGAYLRGLDDLRRSRLAFATECLAFANVPADETLQKLPGGSAVRVQNAVWKQRSPRDLGAGWDFDDVRDHYVRALFGVDPSTLRYSDHDRYLRLGREATALAMASAFTEWRRADSGCNGALIWFLRDLWPGAGWGLIDSQGVPKSPYHALRRTLQPVWIGLTDEGLNGLSVHLGNETPRPLHGTLEVQLFREGRHALGNAALPHVLPPRSLQSLPVAGLLDAFHDLTFAYRFGPLSCDLVVVRWQDGASASSSSRAYYLPDPGRHLHPGAPIDLSAKARRVEEDAWVVTVHSDAFARGICLEAEGYRCDDSHFWLAPGETRTVMLRAVGKPRPLFGAIHALNMTAPVSIKVEA